MGMMKQSHFVITTSFARFQILGHFCPPRGNPQFSSCHQAHALISSTSLVTYCSTSPPSASSFINRKTTQNFPCFLRKKNLFEPPFPGYFLGLFRKWESVGHSSHFFTVCNSFLMVATNVKFSSEKKSLLWVASVLFPSSSFCVSRTKDWVPFRTCCLPPKFHVIIISLVTSKATDGSARKLAQLKKIRVLLNACGFTVMVAGGHIT